jgi:hypothetical protein
MQSFYLEPVIFVTHTNLTRGNSNLRENLKPNATYNYLCNSFYYYRTCILLKGVLIVACPIRVMQLLACALCRISGRCARDSVGLSNRKAFGISRIVNKHNCRIL